MPVWVWVILFFVLAVLFGDKKLWEYEVKFPFKQGIGRGEIEIEGMKKKGNKIEVKFDLEPAYQDKKIDIFLSGKLVHTVASNKNSSGRFFYTEKYNAGDPTEGDEVVVKIDEQEIFKGQLVRD